jgi:hypothetical protein
MTLCLVGVERADGQTNMTKVIVASRNRANTSKNGNKNNFGFYHAVFVCLCLRVVSSLPVY